MTYQIKIIYPKEESASMNKTTERSFNELIEGLEVEDVIKEYENCLSKGYSVSTNFTPPDQGKKGEEPDPFEIAKQFELAAITYKATLKLKATGPYENMVKVAKMIEHHGYDCEVAVKLKINENSPVDIEREQSWFDAEFAKYTINPKAASDDISDLKSLYEALSEEHYKVSINLKAKVKKDDDESFATQLAAYPDDTLISFKLSDANVYGE